MKMNKKNLIRGVAGMIIASSIVFTLTGCGSDKNEVKEYAKEIENNIDEAQKNVVNTTLEENNIIKDENNTISEKDNNVKEENTIVREGNNEKQPNKESYQPKVGLYNTEDVTNNYYHRVAILVQNVELNYIDFAINAEHGSSVDKVNVGNVSGKAERKSDGTYVFTDIVDGNTNKITFTFDSDNSVAIKEDYPSGQNPYGGNRVFFSGEHKYVGKTETNVTDEFSNIYLTSEEVKKDYFVDMWSSEVDATELAVNKDGTFVIDHFTKSSEVHGKYTISGTKIYFTNSDGIKWEGELLMQQAGNHMIKINYEDNVICLYNEDGD